MKKKDIRSEIDFVVWLHKHGLTNKEIVAHVRDRRKAIKEIRKFIKEL